MTSTSDGDVLVESVLVVTVRGGLGFVTSPGTAERVLAAAHVTVTEPGRAMTGVPEVVRSGTAYEEVRGRTRVEQGSLRDFVADLRRGRRTAVVLVNRPS